MAAAGVRPQQARVVLRRIALLEQQFAGRVSHQHRNGAVLEAALMRIELAGGADLDVVGIDQDDRVVVGRACHA